MGSALRDTNDRRSNGPAEWDRDHRPGVEFKTRAAEGVCKVPKQHRQSRGLERGGRCRYRWVRGWDVAICEESAKTSVQQKANTKDVDKS